MPNPNLIGPEQQMQMQGLNPGDIAGMDPAQLEAMGIPEQFGNIQQDALAMGWPTEGTIEAADQTDIKNRAEQDFDIQSGVDNQLLDSEGRQLSKTDETKDRLAIQVEELNRQVGDTARIERLAKNMHAVTGQILDQYGVTLSNVGAGKEAAEKTLLADNVTNMFRAGGAKELDPTRVEQVTRITNQDIGQEAMKYFDKNPQELGELYKEDPKKAEKIAEAVSLYRQNGNVNHLVTQQLGEVLQDNSDLTLAA